MIYAKVAAVLVVLVALLAVGYYFGEMPYKTKYEALQAADWQNKAQAQEVAKTAIAGQLVDLQRQLKVNADVMQTLQGQNDSVVADRDATLGRVRRLEQLLSVAARVNSSGGLTLSETPSGSTVADASGAGSPTEVERLLIDAKEEAERNADRLDALIAEITPQVTPQ